MRGDDVLVGRDVLCQQATEFLSATSSGLTGLSFEGPAGIGKSTLWRWVLERGRESGATVLVARPTAAEQRLSLAAFGDLVGANPPIDKLPGPQARAVGVALGMEEPDESGHDVTTLCLAATGLLRAFGEAGPLLVAIDDVQWLDASSAQVLSFALRRLEDQPIRVVTTRRTGAGSTGTGAGDLIDGIEVADVGPLGVEELSRIIRTRLGISLPRPTVEQVADACGGNPFYALEFARSMATTSAADASARRLSLPRRLEDVIQERLAALPDEVLGLLLVAAALSRPTVAQVQQALGTTTAVDAALLAAEEADVLEVTADAIAFTHPLLASAVYSAAPDTRLRLLHRRLSEMVTDPEERAVHLALGTVGPDVDAAEVIERAAQALAAKAAVADAARLMAEVLRLLPAEPAARRREATVFAAKVSLEAGDGRHAKTLLQDLVNATPWGVERARVMRDLARVLQDSDGPDAAAAVYRVALDQVEDDRHLHADIEQALAWIECWLGSVQGTYFHAQKAVALVEGLGDSRATMLAISTLAEAEFHMGINTSFETLQPALELEARFGEDVAAGDRPSANLAFHLLRSDRLAEARALYLADIERETRKGDEIARLTFSLLLSQLEFLAGNYDEARRLADESHERALQAGSTSLSAVAESRIGLVDGVRGHFGTATAHLLAALDVAVEQHNLWAQITVLWGLGLIGITAGTYAESLPYMERATAGIIRTGVREPGSFHHLHNHVEALVYLGRADETAPLIDMLSTQGQARGRVWALAAAARCRALVAVSHGDQDGARVEADRSVQLFGETEYRLELARSLIVLGGVLRRDKSKSAARDVLERAGRICQELGSPPWIERCQVELARIGGRPRGGGALSETERQVVDLVAQGLSNKMVAERLSLSVRSVESNLTSVYRKLQVRSRTEMIRKQHEGAAL